MPVLKSLVGSVEAPQQHAQPSRKGKKAWRKNVDVTEVEEGLEALNEAIIRGGVVSEKPSKELFAIDTKKDVKLRNKIVPQHTKTLRSDEIIKQRSAVAAVPSRKRPGDVLGNGMLPEKRPRVKYVSHKEMLRLRDVADGHHETTVVVKDATYDPWDVATVPEPKTELYPFIPPKEEIKPPQTLKHKPITLAANGKDVPAVKKPSGGYSYNPRNVDYEARLNDEGAKAVAAELQRLEEEETERLRQEAAARSAAEADAADARAELSEWDEDSAWEGFESGAETDKPAAKRPERKTKAQRNRIKRRKEEEARAKLEAVQKKKRQDALRIKQIAKEVAERERARTLAKEDFGDSESEGDDDKLRRRRLGNARLPEKELELVLPDELEESLRLLKPEGNLLKDRYRSLLVRGKMETRKHIPFKKRAKVKWTEKWGFKDFRI